MSVNRIPKPKSTHKRNANRTEIPPFDCPLPRELPAPYALSIDPSTFYWVDPFCNPRLDRHLCSTYLSDHHSPFHVLLISRSGLYANLRISGEMVDQFRAKSHVCEQAENNHFTGSWCYLDDADAQRLVDHVCHLYQAPSATVLCNDATKAAARACNQRWSKIGQSPEGRVPMKRMPRLTEKASDPSHPYRTWLQQHFYGHQRATVLRQYMGRGHLEEEEVAELRQYREPPQIGDRHHPIWYNAETSTIEYKRCGGRYLLRALYHHLAKHQVRGFITGTGEHRSTKWADAYWGIIDRIHNSETNLQYASIQEQFATL